MTPVYDLSITDALLSTTRAVRRRLDLERPVEREVILECLRLAQQAPTGSNRQGWRWLVITDRKTRERLGEIYREGAGDYLTNAVASAEGGTQDQRVFTSAHYLAENLQRVPVHVIPCIETDLPENPPMTVWPGLMGSIFPAVWSFQLALRARGLGSTLTTLHLRAGHAAQTLLGIPDHIMQVALLPVAYTLGTEFKSASREPIEDIVHFDKW
ncbi:MAG: nitroreductase family protein [Pseudomonadota bacterium]